MSIKRYSPSFPIFIFLAMVIMAVTAMISFSAHITPQKCEESGTPVLYIDTEGGKKIKTKEKYVKATYSINYGGESLSGSCKIRGRGNTTWKTRELYKKPYLLKLDKASSLLGLPEAEKWVLMANTADKTSLRNAYAYYLAKNVWKSGLWTPDAKFLALFVNGRYEGLYALTEKIEIRQNRLPLDTKGGSFLFEVRSPKSKAWNFKSKKGIAFTIKEPNNLGDEEYKKRQDFVQQVEDIIFSEDFADKEKGWQKYLDLQSFADWYLINEFTKNHDARFQASCYLYYNSSTGKIYMGPIWDFDISCGNISYDGCENPEGFWVREQSQWFKRLFEDPFFADFVRERWNSKKELIKKSPEWIHSAAEEIEGPIMINDQLWKNIGHRQWPHAPGWKRRKTFAAEVNYFSDWVEKRFEWMDKAINTSGVQK